MFKRNKMATPIDLNKNQLRMPNKRKWPLKLVKIIQAVFNKPLLLDHVRYVKENGRHTFYTAPYSPINTEKINFGIANTYAVEWLELESDDDVTIPYKIIIRNPGSLRKRDMNVGFTGLL